MKRLLLTGWDAADWKIIDPLLKRGEMPNLAGLIAAGVRGNMATIHPALSPMLWTSIATGKRPHKHGVHGFTEPTEDGLGVRPISNLGRKTKALWNILNQNGKRSIVAGWWPSHPAEPIRGAMVSNLFPLSMSAAPDAPMLPGTVSPPEWAERLAELRVHGSELTGEMLRMFVPDYERVNQDEDHSLQDLAGIIAETISIHAAATDLMEREPWDFAAVYYSGIDHFSHRFMRYHAGKTPRAKGQSEAALFQHVIQNAYRYHDAMLGRLLELAGPECAVMVVSDHGFHSDRLLPDYIPAEAAGPVVEHRQFGMFCMRAPGVLHGERIHGASVLDITPTVLHLFGLPPGADMDGKVLINAFRDRTLAERLPSWDAVDGDDGCHPEHRRYDGAASAEALKQLVDLGYIAPPGENARKSVDECLTENRYNLARAYTEGGQIDNGMDILRQLLAEDPEQGRFYSHLFHCLMQKNMPAEAGELLDAFDAASALFSVKAAKELRARQEACPDAELPGVAVSPDRAEIYARRALAEKASGFARPRLLMRCRLALAQADTPEQRSNAAALLEQVADQKELAMFLAEGFALLGEDARALEFARVARLDYPENHQAMAIEARIHHTADRHERAVDCAVESLSLVYFQPHLHYILGLSLRVLGEEAKAEQAFRVALSQAPGLVAAHDELAKVLRQDRARIGEASLHMAVASELRSKATRRRTSAQLEEAVPEQRVAGLPAFEQLDGGPLVDRSRVVTVVAGLPRSGTSMMMQVLASAGIDPYTDAKRQADEDNPRGYFEHGDATRLHEDVSWVPAARGRVVKIVAHLLPYLPAGEEYRIVFMHRDLDEVVASQRAMLSRLGRAGGSLDDEKLKRTYTGQLVKVQNWLRTRAGVSVLAVSYDSALDDPEGTASRLAEFLGKPFDAARGASAIDAALRRQVKTTTADLALA